MARESEVVAHVRVGDQRVTWDDRHVRILTLTDIEVIEPIKGAKKGQHFTIYQVGGTLDGVTYDIPGRLFFTAGEEMIFFAYRFKDMVVSYGMGLGKFAVLERDGVKVVSPEWGDVSFVQMGPGSKATGEGPVSEVESLQTFLARVRRAIQAKAQGGER